MSVKIRSIEVEAETPEEAAEALRAVGRTEDSPEIPPAPLAPEVCAAGEPPFRQLRTGSLGAESLLTRADCTRLVHRLIPAHLVDVVFTSMDKRSGLLGGELLVAPEGVRVFGVPYLVTESPRERAHAMHLFDAALVHAIYLAPTVTRIHHETAARAVQAGAPHHCLPPAPGFLPRILAVPADFEPGEGRPAPLRVTIAHLPRFHDHEIVVALGVEAQLFEVAS